MDEQHLFNLRHVGLYVAHADNFVDVTMSDTDSAISESISMRLQFTSCMSFIVQKEQENKVIYRVDVFLTFIPCCCFSQLLADKVV